MVDSVGLEWSYDPQTDSIVFKGHITSTGWANEAEAKVLLQMLKKQLPKNDASRFLRNVAVIFDVAETPSGVDVRDRLWYREVWQ